MNVMLFFLLRQNILVHSDLVILLTVFLENNVVSHHALTALLAATRAKKKMLPHLELPEVMLIHADRVIGSLTILDYQLII